MRHPLAMLCAVVLAGAGLCLGAYHLAGRWYVHRMAPVQDELAWLRMEFRLGDPELARIRSLHEAYVPRCQEFCTQIARRKKALQALLEKGDGITPEAERTVAEIAALRAQCQTAMLKHFAEVSRAMPPDQGRRYLAEMQRLTVGHHEEFEHRMSGAGAATGHGHH